MNNDSSKGKITVLGIDLAKNSFQLHGVDEQGNRVLKKKLTRKQLVAFIAQLPPCLPPMSPYLSPKKTKIGDGNGEIHLGI